MRACAPGRGRGFTFLGLLFVITVLSMTATMASVVWSTVQRRENERELVFDGRQFEAAIERYHQRAKPGNPAYPRRLEDLLRDPRVPQVMRDLRRIYVDPMTGSTQWGLVRLADGSIVGVHSRSKRSTLKDSTIGLFGTAGETYADWRFIAPSALDSTVDAPAAAAPRPASTPATSRRASSPATRTPSLPQSAPAPQAEAPPAETEAGPPPRTIVPRPSQEDYRSRTPEACDRIAAYDEMICVDSGARFGEDAAGECRDSALKRNLACSLAEEGPLPGLVLRRN